MPRSAALGRKVFIVGCTGAGALVCGWTGRGGPIGAIAVRAAIGAVLGVMMALLTLWLNRFWTGPR